MTATNMGSNFGSKWYSPPPPPTPLLVVVMLIAAILAIVNVVKLNSIDIEESMQMVMTQLHVTSLLGEDDTSQKKSITNILN